MPILTELVKLTRRRRVLRDLIRNIRWVAEARRTPPLWSEYSEEPYKPEDWGSDEYDPRADD